MGVDVVVAGADWEAAWIDALPDRGCGWQP